MLNNAAALQHKPRNPERQQTGRARDSEASGVDCQACAEFECDRAATRFTMDHGHSSVLPFVCLTQAIGPARRRLLRR